MLEWEHASVIFGWNKLRWFDAEMLQIYDWTLAIRVSSLKIEIPTVRIETSTTTI